MTKNRITQTMIKAILNPAKAMVRLMEFDKLRGEGKQDQVNLEEEGEILKGLDEVADSSPLFKAPLAEFKKTLRKFGGKEKNIENNVKNSPR